MALNNSPPRDPQQTPLRILPTSKRDSQGRFAKGTAPGPGRRPRTVAPPPTTDDLIDLSNTIDPAHLYFHAIVARSIDDKDPAAQLKQIEKDFPPHIAKRIRTQFAISTAAEQLLLKRLRAELESS